MKKSKYGRIDSRIFFFIQRRFFLFFTIKLGHFYRKGITFSSYKHSSLTSKIWKRGKTKFGMIDSWNGFCCRSCFGGSLKRLLWSNKQKTFIFTTLRKKVTLQFFFFAYQFTESKLIPLFLGRGDIFNICSTLQ